MSLIRVSMGVFPTRRTKKSCSMTEEETVRREGKRSSSFPNLLGWLGYWLLTYSSNAHCDFSCRPSTWLTSDRPQASADRDKKQAGEEAVKISSSTGHRHEGQQNEECFNFAGILLTLLVQSDYNTQQHREDSM